MCRILFQKMLCYALASLAAVASLARPEVEAIRINDHDDENHNNHGFNNDDNNTYDNDNNDDYHDNSMISKMRMRMRSASDTHNDNVMI